MERVNDALLDAIRARLDKDETAPGSLSVVATPIGNLGDITLRALAVLQRCDAVLCEDTRVSAKLLNHFGIRKPLVSCFAQREQARIPEILDRLRAGQRLALISDAGTPAIRDPGAAVVEAVCAAGFPVEAVAGPSALSAALSIAGALGEAGILFEGYAERKPEKLLAQLRARTPDSPTLVLYEAPHRLHQLLSALREGLPAQRIIVLRELTKAHAQRWAGALSEWNESLTPAKGELVLVFPPPAAAPVRAWGDDEVLAAAAALAPERLKPRPLAARLAAQAGRPASEIYALLSAARRA